MHSFSILLTIKQARGKMCSLLICTCAIFLFVLHCTNSLPVLLSTYNLTEPNAGSSFNQTTAPAHFEYLIGGEAISSVSSSSIYSQFIYKLLIDTSNSTILCTGNFITQDKILTAAHCCSKDFLSLRLKCLDSNSKKEIKKIHGTYCTPNPAYEKHNDSTYDLAVLHLPPSFNLYCKNSIKPITLKLEHSLDSSVLLFGFGATDRTGEQLPSDLMQLETSQANSVLARAVAGYRLVMANPKGTVCGGDSGGPVIQIENDIPYLVGVLYGRLKPYSFKSRLPFVPKSNPKNDTCEPGDYSVAERIADNIEFIKTQAPNVQVVQGNDSTRARLWTWCQVSFAKLFELLLFGLLVGLIYLIYKTAVRVYNRITSVV